MKITYAFDLPFQVSVEDSRVVIDANGRVVANCMDPLVAHGMVEFISSLAAKDQVESVNFEFDVDAPLEDLADLTADYDIIRLTETN